MDTNKKWVFVFLIAAILLAILSSLSSVQKKFSSYVDQENRIILAKVTNYYGVDQTPFLILKVKSAQGIQIEVYEVDSKTSSQIFRQKFELSMDADAYMTIDKSSTNLALSDVDKDGHLDIMAPSVDRNGNLRLNTFRYNPDLKNFEPYSESNN